jgi:formylglycine-generating enzyme required for sulfatase activity/TolB-like protein
MNNKKAMIVLALIAASGPAFGQQQAKPILVVPPFEKRGTDLETAELNNLQEYLINAFINTGRFQVPDRNALTLLSEEHKFQLDDWADEKKSAEMGKVLNADYIVRVIVMHDGEANLLMARVLDVKTAGGLSAEAMEFTTQRDARGKMDEFVNGILARIGGRPGPELPGPAAPELAAPEPVVPVPVVPQAPSPPVPPVTAPPAPSPPEKILRPQDTPAGFVLVEGGAFMMGSPANEPDRYGYEGPQRQVTVKSFYMGKYEVTQKEWRELMGNNPGHFRGDKLPVEQVSWFEAIEYCNKRSVKEGLNPAYRGAGNSIICDWNANGYRLPTEAEWEYAAKGGNKNFLTYIYSGSNNVDAVGWYEGNSGAKTQPVGTKAPNELGIYDMSGNVWEWCWDWYGGYSGEAQTDPVGPLDPVSFSGPLINGGLWHYAGGGAQSSGSNRVFRGGSWFSSAKYLRSSNRNSGGPSNRNYSLGFRLVRAW